MYSTCVSPWFAVGVIAVRELASVTPLTGTAKSSNWTGRMSVRFRTLPPLLKLLPFLIFAIKG